MEQWRRPWRSYLRRLVIACSDFGAAAEREGAALVVELVVEAYLLELAYHPLSVLSFVAGEALSHRSDGSCSGSLDLGSWFDG